MKIEVNGVEIMTLTDIQKQVMLYEMPEATMKQEIVDSLKWILEHKLERCSERLKNEWTQKLVASGAESVPLKKEKFAEAVFKHPEYQDRSKREQVAEAKRVAEEKERADDIQRIAEAEGLTRAHLYNKE